MDSLLRRVFRHVTQHVEGNTLPPEIKSLRDEALKESESARDDFHTRNVGRDINAAAVNGDTDTLRIYRDVSPFTHRTLGYVITALRDGLGVHDVHGIITVAHIEAFNEVHSAILQSQPRPENVGWDSIMKITGIALADLDRKPRIINILQTCGIKDAGTIADVMEDMLVLHPAISAGAL